MKCRYGKEGEYVWDLLLFSPRSSSRTTLIKLSVNLLLQKPFVLSKVKKTFYIFWKPPNYINHLTINNFITFPKMKNIDFQYILRLIENNRGFCIYNYRTNNNSIRMPYVLK